MNHIKLRRLALTAASVSIGLLCTILLLWSGIRETNGAISARAAEIENNAQEKQLSVSISCTPLEIRQLASYDGKFFEDGSGREVAEVAAIMLYNSSDRVVPYAFVTVYTESCKYIFEAYMLPPRSQVLVPERYARKLTQTDITDTFGWTTVKNEAQRPALEIREQGMGELQIINLSGKRVRDLTVYYKTYIAEGDFYMGGKAFSAVVEEIPPGETAVICPDNYAAGYSKVIYYE